MAEFTKGPWMVDGNGNVVTGWIDPYRDRPWLLAAVCHWGVLAPHVDNSHIIAAAPEMLWALKDIEHFLKTHGYDTGLVKSVIAKAEGK